MLFLHSRLQACIFLIIAKIKSQIRTFYSNLAGAPAMQHQRNKFGYFLRYVIIFFGLYRVSFSSIEIRRYNLPAEK